MVHRIAPLCIVYVLLLAITGLSPLSAIPPVKDRSIIAFEIAAQDEGRSLAIAPSNLSGLVRWSHNTQILPLCIRWLEHQRSLAPTDFTLKMALADAFHLAQEWSALRNLTISDSWLVEDHIRLAYLARSERNLNNPEWQQAWDKACNTAFTHPDQTRSLVVFASQWKEWGPQIDELLWVIIRRNDRLSPWASGLQHQVYSARGNVEGLSLLTLQLLEWSPENLDLINNQVLFAMILGDHDTATRLVLRLDSSKIEYILTLACYERWSGNAGKARDLVDRLPPGWDAIPQRIPYAHAAQGRTVPELFPDDSSQENITPPFILDFLRTLARTETPPAAGP